MIHLVENVFFIFSPDRSKYDLHVKSYKSDKKQLELELRKAVDRIRNVADRDELLAFNDASINVDQVRRFFKK